MTVGPTLVTGAGGYVGPHVVSALLDRGNEVIAVLRPGSSAPLDPRSRVVFADVLDPALDLDVFGDATGVVHLAWKDGFAHNAPSHMLQVSSHYRFLNRMAERGATRITALGTMHEVGYWEGVIEESTPTNPQSQYGIAKDALRRSLRLALPESVSLVWVRAYYIYGDDRRNRSIFARLLEAADEGKTLFPFTTGKNEYDFIRVDDLGRQIAAVHDAIEETGVINCCTGRPVSLAQKVEEFIAENGLGLTLQYGAFPDRPYDSPGVWGDASRIQEILARDT